MRLLLTADTRVPKRARDLPERLWRAIDAAGVVVHAGDWVDVSLLDRIEQRAARLIGVYGNNDGPALRARLPEVAKAELAGVRLAVVHETGRQPYATFMTATISGGRLAGVTLHPLVE